MRSSIQVAIVAVLVSVAHHASAQVPEDSSHLRRGIVGIEAGYGQMPGVSLFFFSSPTTSWLVGIDHVTTDYAVGTRIARATSLGGRIGVRKWAGAMTGPFKVFVGAGISAADEDPAQSSWIGDSFGYGELGSTLFVGPHLSLNASGELSVAYERERTVPMTDAAVTPGRFLSRGSRLRLSAALYLF